MKKLLLLIATSVLLSIGIQAQYKVLFNFSGVDGSYPYGSLTLSGGTLYGMTFFGGPSNYGGAFSIDTNGSGEKTLFDFGYTSYPAGAHPWGGLIQSGGIWYGMAEDAGAHSHGVIFSYNQGTGIYTDLLDFNVTNGEGPLGDLTPSGNILYGMAQAGGAHNAGVIFSFNTSTDTYTDLYDFNGTDGSRPMGTLALSGNVVYGMTERGGTPDSAGVIFSMHTDGTNFKVLHSFITATGSSPQGSVTLSGKMLYGMTSGGGANNYGAIFSIDTNGLVYTDLHDFNGTAGESPYGSVTVSGNFMFGMAAYGGAYQWGNIFAMYTNGTGYADIFDFNDTNGAFPTGNLILSGNVLYGMATNGGANVSANDGDIFSFRLPATLAVNELAVKDGSIDLYPNPNDGLFTIKSLILSNNSSIEIYNMLGEIVYKSILTGNETQINLVNQAVGLYLYRIITNEGTLQGSGKLIIQ